MDASTPSENNPQSFVIRLWQASPRQLRGTIRHVQSGVQRGFTQLEQAVSFIEQRVNTNAASTAQPAPRRAPSTFDWSWLARRQMRFAWAVMGVLALALLALLLANPNANVPLSGAAVSEGSAWVVPLAFLAGGVLGGLAIGLWFRFARR